MNPSFIQDENAIESIDGITYGFPYNMHERDLSSYIVPWHWHEELEFDYAFRGSIVVETMKQSYTIHQGEAYFINTNVMNTKRKAEESSMTVEHAHLFHPILLTGHYKSIFETKYLNPILKNQSLEVVIIRENTPTGKEFLKYLHTLTRLHGKSDSEFQIRNLLSQAWITLTQEIDSQRQRNRLTVSSSQDRIRTLLNYLHQHYAEKISLSDLSDHAGISTKECIRCFKNTLHQTPVEYLTSYRLEQARRLLRETNTPITEIAFMTGFQNSAYFSKVFRTSTGMTPGDYRHQYQQD